MKRLFSVFILLTTISVRLFADGFTLTTSAPSTVEVGDKFRVQFTVNTQGASHFTPPDFKGFEVIYGPSTSSQSSFQIINGRTTQSSSITYTFVVLCSVAGTYTINPASVTVDGTVIKSNPVKVKVLSIGQGGSSQGQQQSSGSHSSSQQGSPQTSRPVTSGSNISTNDLFMTATLSRTNVYEQEAVLLTYKIYTLVNLTQLEGKLPTLDGFQIQEVSLPRNKNFQLEQYNGRNYRSVIWSQYVLFPQKSGDLVIPSITYEGTVVVRARNIDPIDAFFNGITGMQEMTKHITTPRLVMHVSPLPNKPANFSGAVGQFSISSSLSPQEVDANDAVTLRLNVKGVGNMKLINTPEVAFPKDFETYDAKVNDKFSLTRSGLSGSKEFEYLVVPRHAGTYTIPATDFVYFDTESRTYKTLQTEPYTLKVNKGVGGNAHTADYSNNQQDVTELNQDIRYIKQGDVTLYQHGEQLWGTTRYALYYAVPFILFIAALVIGYKRMAAANDSVRVRGRKANKTALKRMKKANKLLADKKQSEFYDEVLRAMLGYVADKLNIPQERLSKDNIQSELTASNVSQEHIAAFIKTLDDCEFARYAPGDATTNMESVYNSAIRIITQMEGSI
ncbi:MAG: protein BatD [Bacteroidaceae bacterium]|nr:protein BatD [Bacteroidaceae bacterium]